MTKTELLSPSGDILSLKAAITGGADAVYLGLNRFNARMKAENFTAENLNQWVDYAHLRGTKVYLTLNTLIKENEIQSALETIKIAAQANVDAIILTEMGLISEIKKIAPDISIHLSTQCGIHNLEGAKFAKRIGANRIILSRETPLSEIKHIIDNCDIEVEVFVHGALCVAFSGACLMSGITEGKSGNRGECKQLCRQKYLSNLSNEEKYYLSTKDLCLIDRIKELQNIGVSSIKIEGRLKSAEYVFATALAYRHALDGKSYLKDTAAMKIAYNRGYTEGYFDGSNDKIISADIQNHIGIPIGTVNLSQKDGNFYKNVILTKHTLKTGDGIKFLDGGMEIGGGSVSGIKNVVYTAKPIKIGAEVRLTYQNVYIDASERKIKLEMNFSASLGSKPQLSVKSQGYSATVSGDYLCEKSEKPTENLQYIKDNLSRTGDTPFNDLNIVVDCNNNIFIPKSILNSMRRAAIELLCVKILDGYKKKCNNIQVDKHNFVKQKDKINLVIVGSLDQVNYIPDNTTHIALYPFDFTTDVVIKAFLEQKKSTDIKLGIVLPNIMFDEDLKVFYKTVENYNTKLDFVQINNISQVLVAERLNLPYIIGTGIGAYNHTLNKICRPDAIIASCELNAQDISDIREFSAVPVLNYISNSVPLMQLTHCPYKANGKNCGNCGGKLTYSRQKKIFTAVRTKLDRCYFTLYGENELNKLNITTNFCLNLRLKNDFVIQ